MRRTLVFGGARSGKSRFAEGLSTAASRDGKQVIYIATAQPASDPEMQARITHHQQQRPAHWITVEAPLHLGAALAKYSKADTVVMVDCLTVWLSNCLFAGATDFPEIGTIEPPVIFIEERRALLSALENAVGDIVLVSNEVGMGIVPMGAVSRWFVDEAGRLNQSVAALCEQVVWVAAGLPLYLKGQAC